MGSGHHGPDIATGDFHRLCVSPERTELDDFGVLVERCGMARLKVINIAAVEDEFMVGKNGAESALDYVSPMRALAPIIGQPPKYRRRLESSRKRFEANDHFAPIGHANDNPHCIHRDWQICLRSLHVLRLPDSSMLVGNIEWRLCALGTDLSLDQGLVGRIGEIQRFCGGRRACVAKTNAGFPSLQREGGSDQLVMHREGSGPCTISHIDLDVDIGEMAFDSLFAQREFIGHFPIAAAAGEEAEHLGFTRAQVGREIGLPAAARKSGDVEWGSCPLIQRGRSIQVMFTFGVGSALALDQDGLVLQKTSLFPNHAFPIGHTLGPLEMVRRVGNIAPTQGEFAPKAIGQDIAKRHPDAGEESSCPLDERWIIEEQRDLGQSRDWFGRQSSTGGSGLEHRLEFASHRPEHSPVAPIECGLR